MRRVFALLLFVAVFVSNPHAQQWTSQGGDSLGILYSVHFANVDTGWIGNQGGIYKTTNGGKSWIHLNSGLTDAATSMFFLDANTGWAVAYQNSTNTPAIRRTGDGGATWTGQTLPGTGAGSYGSLTNVWFANGNLGWISSLNGYIARTTNGGVGWTVVHSGVNPVRGTSFVGENLGWVVGDAGGSAKTTDGSLTWNNVTGTLFSTMQDVFFTSANMGWIVGGAKVSKTTDGGATWTAQTSPASAVTAVSFADGMHGIMAGGNGNIAVTTNGGSTWTKQTIAGLNLSSTALNAVFMVNPYTAWVVGNGGVVLKYVDTAAAHPTLTSPVGGETWTVGSVKNITWSTSLLHVKLEYSTNNAGTWSNITASTDGAAGTYAWTIPNAVSSQVKVRISDVNNAAVNTVSPASFNISAATALSEVHGMSHDLTFHFGNSTLRFPFPEASAPLVLKALDASGREMGTLLKAHNAAEADGVVLAASALPSGVYFVEMVTAGHTYREKISATP